MKKMMGYECSLCGKKLPANFQGMSADDGGNLKRSARL